MPPPCGLGCRFELIRRTTVEGYFQVRLQDRRSLRTGLESTAVALWSVGGFAKPVRGTSKSLWCCNIISTDANRQCMAPYDDIHGNSRRPTRQAVGGILPVHLAFEKVLQLTTVLLVCRQGQGRLSFAASLQPLDVSADTATTVFRTR